MPSSHDHARGPGAVTFASPNSTNTTASFGADGIYVLRLTASDTALSAFDEVTVTVFVYEQATGPAPTVAFNSLKEGAEITAPTDIYGTVSGGAWQLEYALVEGETAPVQGWHTFASGAGAVTNGVLGRFDPTVLMNGTYAIRLVSTDASGQTSVMDSSAVVARQMKIGHFAVSFTDLSLPVAGVPVQVTRSYDSRDKRRGDFGAGWTLGVTSWGASRRYATPRGARASTPTTATATASRRRWPASRPPISWTRTTRPATRRSSRSRRAERSSASTPTGRT